MKIGGLQKFSLIDYPEKISAIIFTQGCNFRCLYCHNPQLLSYTNDSFIEELLVFDFLKSRIGKLDAVVLSGGEPCLQKDLSEFIKKVKSMGFAVKLDTNGSSPEVLQQLIDNGFLDYIAMDIKAPLAKYETITKSKINTDDILKSIDIIINSGLDYEFRTTVVKSLITKDDFFNIGKLICGAKKYYLQKFIYQDNLKNYGNYSHVEFLEIKNNLLGFVSECFIR